MSEPSQQKLSFIYNGVEYDATDYAQRHPGGPQILRNMKSVRKDFTQYFRALHSDQAESILKSFPVVTVGEPSQSSVEYLQMYKQVEKYFQPSWYMEMLLVVLLSVVLVTAMLTTIPLVSILGYALVQVVGGWMAHSCAHSRDKNLNLLGRVVSTLHNGLSLEWWSPKHNSHHMFTNIKEYDEDIQHQYKVYLYPFLYLKWRYDSLESSILKRNYIDMAMIAANYAVIFSCWQNIPYFLTGNLIGGFYSAYILIGNHEREARFKHNPEMPFLDHQLRTCRNYVQQNIFWVILMGGMQYQAEHHLFPQIPFYRIAKAKPVIHRMVNQLGKAFIYGDIL